MKNKSKVPEEKKKLHGLQLLFVVNEAFHVWIGARLKDNEALHYPIAELYPRVSRACV